MKNNKNKTIQIIFGSLLLLFGNINFVYAGEIDQVLAKYYEASAKEDLGAYYSTRIVPEDELESRQSYTKLLWSSFDTVSYKITDIVITEKDEAAFIEYNLEAVVAGLNDDGTDGTISYKEDMVATLLKDKDGKWKIFETIPKTLFDLRTENILAEKVAGGTCGDCLVEKEKSFWEKLRDFAKNIITKIVTTFTGTGIPEVITNIPEDQTIKDVPLETTNIETVVEEPVLPEVAKPIVPIVEKPPVIPVVPLPPVVKPPVVPVTPPKTEPVLEDKPVLVVPPVVEEPVKTPPPAINSFNYSPKPTSTIRSTELTWSASNVDICTITSPYNKFSHTGGKSGTVSTGYFSDAAGTYVYTLVCKNSATGLTSSLAVTIDIPAAPVATPPPTTPTEIGLVWKTGTITVPTMHEGLFEMRTQKVWQCFGDECDGTRHMQYLPNNDIYMTCNGYDCPQIRKEESKTFDEMRVPPSFSEPADASVNPKVGDRYWILVDESGEYMKIEILAINGAGPDSYTGINLKWGYAKK